MTAKLKVKTANQWLRTGRIVRNNAESAGYTPKPVYERWQTVKVTLALDASGVPFDAYGDAILTLLTDHDCLLKDDCGDRLFFEVEAKNRTEIKQLLKRFELPWKRYKGNQIAISTQRELS